MKNKFFIILLGTIFFASCKLEKINNPNNSDLDNLSEDATKVELDGLVSGTEASMRRGMGIYVTASGSVSRELYLFDGDPRNTADLLGKQGTLLDNNVYYSTGSYGPKYNNIKTANVLLKAVDGTSLVTDTQKEIYKGWAKMVKAHELILVLNLLGDNGIRVDVDDPQNLGPFLKPKEALGEILKLLDASYEHFSNVEDKFDAGLPIKLSDGIKNLEDPKSSLRVKDLQMLNRALSARAATYREDWEKALDYLKNSFFDLDAVLSLGMYHSYSTASGDITNQVYKIPGLEADNIYMHADVYNKFEDNDLRKLKAKKIDPVVVKDELTGEFETALYPSNTSAISMIRNEELILIYAEAHINNGNFAEAVKAINKIRKDNGLGDYSGDEDKDALIEEMLWQRTFSLWGEGHRLQDLRRYDRLNKDYLPLDREGDVIHINFPIPASENV